jgi:hypothetical protein
MKRYIVAVLGLGAASIGCSDVSEPVQPPLRFQAAVQSACVPRPAGLVSWWSGDRHAGDLIGGRHGQFALGPSFGAGKVGEAFSFAGGNFVIVLDDPALTLGTNEFTIELWAHFNRLQGRDPFISHDEGGGINRKWIFWYDAAGHGTLGGPALRFHAVTPLQYHGDAVSASWNPSAGRWYHVAIVRYGTTYTLYIDGALAASALGPLTLPNPASELLIGGAEAYTFDGSLDEVSLYDRGLLGAEIAAIASAGAAGKCKAGLRPLHPSVLTPPAPVFDITHTCDLLQLPSGELENAKVPSGYLVIDTKWHPACPGSSPGVPGDNFWTMAPYRDPRVAEMVVCRNQPGGGVSGGVWQPLKAPPGWYISENPATTLAYIQLCNNDFQFGIRVIEVAVIRRVRA